METDRDYTRRVQEETDRRLKRLEHIMLGNGEVGIAERVRLLEQQQREILGKLQVIDDRTKLIVSQRKAVENQMRGGYLVLSAIVAVLGLLGAGGYVGVRSILNALP